MLVLQRKKDEAIVIDVGGERVWVTVLNVPPNGGQQVVLGVSASEHVIVNRQEVQDEIDKEKK